ncbi:MAG: hypothetical protein BWZ10_01847 [candidate division BRC1 bacterium ADurb.BinA364]|nr:MAG: hypothetical protein BWZ10_01847 [candidate division BRC1 bacterium ADurb.BinA364]
MLVGGQKRGQRIDLRLPIADQRLPIEFGNANAFDGIERDGFARAGADVQNFVQRQILGQRPAAGEQGIGLRQFRSRLRIVPHIAKALAIAAFKAGACRIGLMPEPGGAWSALHVQSGVIRMPGVPEILRRGGRIGFGRVDLERKRRQPLAAGRGQPETAAHGAAALNLGVQRARQQAGGRVGRVHEIDGAIRAKLEKGLAGAVQLHRRRCRVEPGIRLAPE